MAGINTLNDIYEQKGENFMRVLMDNYVIVNRQLNGSFFGMSVSESGETHFYKKGGEITTIDRILMKYYDRAIAQIESLPADAKLSIPSNLLFGMEYVNAPDLDEGIAPQNCLTLSYIQILDPAGNHKYVHDKESLDKWSAKLGLNPAPILFAGYLNAEQKAAILDFVYTPAEQQLRKFKSTSFTQYVLNMLGAKLDDGESIDEIIFRFYDGESNENGAVLAKLIDPVFSDMARNEQQPKKTPDDYLYLIIIDLMNFIEMYTLKDLMSVIDRSKSFEDNYINLVDKIYVDFIDKFKYKYLDVSLSLPEFMRRPDFDINVELIRSDKVKELIQVCPTFKEIYKILMNFFRKKKNRATGLFSTNLVLQFNKLVDKIKKIVIGDNMSESYFPSFYEFSSTISEEFDFMNALTVKQRYDKHKNMRKVNIMVDYFQPITNDHINSAKLMHSKNNLPVVLVMLTSKHRNSKYPISSQMAKRLLQLVRGEYGELIIDVVEINVNSVDSIISAIYPKYQPILWGATKGKMNDYLLQIDFAKNKRIAYNIGKNFKLIELPINANCERVLELIRGEKYQSYRDYVPKSIHSEFFNLRSDIANK